MQEVETLQAFKIYIDLQPKKILRKNIDKQRRYQSFTDRRYKTVFENYRKISNYENINFVLETRAIAQMKGLLILIKSYKKHICQK